MGYIDKEVAEKAIAALMPSMSTPDGSGENDHLVLAAQEICADAMKTIHELPEVDAAPVVHGRWICKGVDECFCSVCKTEAVIGWDTFPVKTRRCPECGTIMDLEG